VSAPAQPRVPAGFEGGGQFTTYGRPTLPVQRVAAAAVLEERQLRPGDEERTAPDGTAYTVHRFGDVDLSVVAVCCAGCVYGNPA
jgi:hypothetical protein